MAEAYELELSEELPHLDFGILGLEGHNFETTGGDHPPALDGGVAGEEDAVFGERLLDHPGVILTGEKDGVVAQEPQPPRQFADILIYDEPGQFHRNNLELDYKTFPGEVNGAAQGGRKGIDLNGDLRFAERAHMDTCDGRKIAFEFPESLQLIAQCL